MKYEFSEKYKSRAKQIIGFIENFDVDGKLFGDGDRNKIKIFRLDQQQVNIKSFKIPNVVNKFAYRFLRKSKAERSFGYAQILLDKGIGTPQPIAFAEEKSAFTFQRSYYVSEHLDCEFTYRSMILDGNLPDWENMLRAFTRFTYRLHEQQVEFLDHSPGNTLIDRKGEEYEFFLVDLNRMNFRELDFEARMKNMSRLTPQREMIQIMASEYAKLSSWPEEEVFERMWYHTTEFQRKFQRKKELKRKLRFWKKK